MLFEKKIKETVLSIVSSLYSGEFTEESVQIQKTKKDFSGDFTLVVFPFVRYSKKSVDDTAKEIGDNLLKKLSFIKEYSVIKGFLNLAIRDEIWLEYFNSVREKEPLFDMENQNQSPVVVEYSSPNTNKPLHLGHIRNNLLGDAICNILQANKYNVIRVNLVNDRGIHICKSMLAWIKSANGQTPQSSGLKGDKFVGKYYVEFDRMYKEELTDLQLNGLSRDEAEKQSKIMLEAQQMLQKWEENNEEIRALWTKMNSWVYDGFDKTYKTLGIKFDKIYYESDTYLLGKEIVEDGLNKNVFYKHEDGSIRVNLENEGLDEKVLLRADGTSVYITQDLGTATLRANEFNPQKMIYVVGNEQNYHFEVLKLILDKKLGYDFGKTIYHLSYGMVELPSGKMKSREGTVVDADDLVENMIEIARENTDKLGKTDNFTEEQLKNLSSMIGIGALKYFILKIDPKKNMLFNPQESIDLNGNTAPFIQYTHARIRSLLRKANEQGIDINKTINLSSIPQQERELLRILYEYTSVVKQAGNELSPALIANYIYELVKAYNHFYQDSPILREENDELRIYRLQLSLYTADVVKNAMKLLGIDVPEQM